MFTVRDRAIIHAPIERCFLLSTSIELVQRTLGMHPVAAESKKVTGLIGAGDQLVWRGWKFGLPQRHVSLISGYEAPVFFEDSQMKGRFAQFRHEHHLQQVGEHVLAYDKVHFALPFGPLGKLVAKHVMLPHITGLLARRFALLKRLAETEGWREYLR